MPLTSKGEKILKNMEEQYGPEKAKQVLYASKNKGTISGIDTEVAMDSPAPPSIGDGMRTWTGRDEEPDIAGLNAPPTVGSDQTAPVPSSTPAPATGTVTSTPPTPDDGSEEPCEDQESTRAVGPPPVDPIPGSAASGESGNRAEADSEKDIGTMPGGGPEQFNNPQEFPGESAPPEKATGDVGFGMRDVFHNDANPKPVGIGGVAGGISKQDWGAHSRFGSDLLPSHDALPSGMSITQIKDCNAKYWEQWKRTRQ